MRQGAHRRDVGGPEDRLGRNHIGGRSLKSQDNMQKASLQGIHQFAAVMTTYLLAYEVLNPQPLRTDIKPLTNMITYLTYI
jgi:hypothetical protein